VSVEVVRGNILDLDVDVIVNSAHPSLLAGGGVSGAIHRAAGPELEKAAAQLGPLKPGQVAFTPGFKLKARYVAHAVAPRYDQFRDNPEFRRYLLLQTYAQALDLALIKLSAQSIAFPSIGTGIYGWPLEEAAGIAMDILVKAPHIKKYLVAFDEVTASAYEKELSARNSVYSEAISD
jgi:O-acetyl-ADP-ribose deacetylase (regulator of RNase III)